MSRCVRRVQGGRFAIGVIGYQKRKPVFVPVDDRRFNTREAAEKALKDEHEGGDK